MTSLSFEVTVTSPNDEQMVRVIRYYIPVTLQNQLCAINQAANILARAYCKKRTSSFANWNDDGNAAAFRMIMIRLALLIERPPLCVNSTVAAIPTDTL